MRIKMFLILILVGTFLGACENAAEEVEELKPETEDSVNTDDINAVPKSDYTLEKNANVSDGPLTIKYPNGEVKAKGELSDGKRTGVWTSYHLNGAKQSENNYKNGMLDGKTAVFYENGNAMYIGYYANGKKHGNWIFYTEDGEVYQEEKFMNGEMTEIKQN